MSSPAVRDQEICRYPFPWLRLISHFSARESVAAKFAECFRREWRLFRRRHTKEWRHDFLKSFPAGWPILTRLRSQFDQLCFPALLAGNGGLLGAGDTTPAAPTPVHIVEFATRRGERSGNHEGRFDKTPACHCVRPQVKWNS